MEKNYVKLLADLVKVRLDHKKVNDIDVLPDLYQIVFADIATNYGKTETRLFLRNDKMVDYEITVRQLAALRLSSNKAALAITWVDEFEGQPNTEAFQTRCKLMIDAENDLGSLKLRCVKRLMIRNKFSAIADAPVYKDNCYTGHVDFSRDSAALRMDKTPEFFDSPEFGMQYKALKDKLQGTALISGKNIEANLVYIPVFEIA